MDGFLDPYFKALWEGVKLNFLFFFIGASATKCFESSRIFRYGLHKDIVSKGQKTKGGGGRTAPPPLFPWVEGLIDSCLLLINL